MAEQPAGRGDVNGIASALRLEILNSEPYTGTVAELLARFGESEATLEARIRVGMALAKLDLSAKPTLSAVGLRAKSAVRVTAEPDTERKVLPDLAPPFLEAKRVRKEAVTALRDSGALGFRDLDNLTYKVMYGARQYFKRGSSRAALIDTYRTGHRAELEACAANALVPGETFVATGYTNKRHVVVLTSDRLLSVLSEGRVDSYELADVSDVGLKRLPFSGVVRCCVQPGSGHVKRFTIVPLEEAMAFHDALLNRAGELHDAAEIDPTARARTNSESHSSSTSPFDALAKLAELHAAGVLSDDEFAQKKRALLKRI
jgi:hypothetical protein